MRIARRYIVKGRVQGVGFRYFTNNLANRIGVYGYVKNLFDGSVEIYAIGTIDQHNLLKKGLRQGPSFSRVDNLIEEEMEVNRGFMSFDIRF